MIGIKLADGAYYPLLDELQQQAKRLVLRPATIDQEAVHILFYRDDDSGFSQPQFIGKIELSNIPMVADTNQDRGIQIIIEPGMNNSLKIRAMQEGQGAEQDFFLSFGVVENIIPDSSAHTKDDEFTVQISAGGEDNFENDAYQQADIEDSWKQEDSMINDYAFEKQQERQPLNFGIIVILSTLATVMTIALSFLFFRISQGNPIPLMQSSQDIKAIFSFLLR